jgi:hypothetical protein
VVLIIVGILLSLKIYDYNEDRKAQVEFDEYVVQLREDVQTAIESVSQAIENTTIFFDNIENALNFLDNPDDDPNSIGKYTKANVRIGLLGQIMDGNMSVISRDKPLVRKAMELEGRLEQNYSIVEQMGNQIDLATVTVNRFRGRQTSMFAERYDLERLTQSEEFRYATQTILERMRGILLFSDGATGYLEDFLTVLEEYD